MLHHCGWGRHRRLCCVAITAGYGYNTLGLLLSVQKGLHTVALPASVSLVSHLEVQNTSFKLEGVPSWVSSKPFEHFF